MSKNGGFTIMEILVAVSIVAILASVIAVRAVDAGRVSRDADRQADLRTLQGAIELYKNKYGRYPEGCNGPGVWSGQSGTAYACASGNEYIRGHVDSADVDGDGDTTERLSFAPQFIPALPKDPKPRAVQSNCLTASAANPSSGYVYTTNAEGTTFKLMARCSVESKTVAEQDSFRICDINPGVCDVVRANSNNTPNHCDPSSAVFQRSFAVWGGWAAPSGGWSSEERTEVITCNLP